MSHDEDRAQPGLDAKTTRIEEAVRRLVLMKETGPKSAAWHRARVRTIWRLHRALEQRADRETDQRCDPAANNDR